MIARQGRSRGGGGGGGEGVRGGKEKKRRRKSIGSISINLARGGLIAALNWVNRIVYLRAMIP